MKIEGMKEAFEYLNEEIAKIEDRTQAGFWEAGLGIMRAAKHRLQPSVISGNLRASGYVRSASDFNRDEAGKLDMSKSEPVPTDNLPPIGVEVGFTANYALYAHENMEGRAPKYLEHPVTENAGKIVEIIKRRNGKS